MRKLAILFMLIPMIAWAKGDVVKEICGVNYGVSYKQAQKQLEKIFGVPDYFQENQFLSYTNRELEGMKIDLISFNFLAKDPTARKQVKILKYAQFLIACDTKEIALSKSSQLAEIMKKKYNVENNEKNGMPAYYGGENPVNDALYGFSIIITGPIEVEANKYYVALNVWPSPFNRF